VTDPGPIVEKIAKALHRHEYGGDQWDGDTDYQQRWLSRAAVAYAVMRYGSVEHSSMPGDLR